MSKMQKDKNDTITVGGNENLVIGLTHLPFSILSFKSVFLTSDELKKQQKRDKEI